MTTDERKMHLISQHMSRNTSDIRIPIGADHPQPLHGMHSAMFANNAVAFSPLSQGMRLKDFNFAFLKI